MRRSVLRMQDQRAGRLPLACVLSGVATQNAVRVRAFEWRGRRWPLHVPGWVPACCRIGRRSSVQVALPVCAEVWTRWRRRVVAGQAAVTFGFVLIAAAVVARAAPPGVLGALVLGLGLLLWARANRNWWVTCRYEPADQTIIVEPTHQNFDDEARALFVRSIR